MSESEHSGQSDHGHQHEITIIVNGREKKVSQTELTFAEIVALSGLSGDANTIFTVTYKRGEGNKEGSLVAGESIKVKDGMIFNVTATGRS
jgi:hypothetical protein